MSQANNIHHHQGYHSDDMEELVCYKDAGLAHYSDFNATKVRINFQNNGKSPYLIPTKVGKENQ